MGMFLLVVLLAMLLLASLSFQRTFYRLSARQLKNWARAGDESAKSLYKLAAHGQNLHGLLWFFVTLFAALLFVTVAQITGFWFALIFIAIFIWVGFAWLPSTRISHFEVDLAAWIGRPLEFLLMYLHRPLIVIGNFAGSHSRREFYTGIYDKADLLAILAEQSTQAGNTIDGEELELARRALMFGDQKVQDHMTPRTEVMTVSPSDQITPKLVGDIHNSGQTMFPVVEKAPERIVGTLKLDDVADIKKSGMVQQLMDTKVFYVHEDHSLAQVLDAFYKTRRRLYSVVNKFEDFVGVITLEQVLEQIIGQPILSDFSDYDQLKAVATHIARTASGHEPESSLKNTETVVE
jgi:CBS domain containing-hemolysin-like protein